VWVLGPPSKEGGRIHAWWGGRIHGARPPYIKLLSWGLSLCFPALLALPLSGEETRAPILFSYAPTNLFFSFLSHTRPPSGYQYLFYPEKLDPSAMDNWFQYNKEYDILICIPCGVVVMPGQGGGMNGHLVGSHGPSAKNFPLSHKERLELLELHEGWVLNPCPRMPEPGSSPIPHLPVREGFRCVKCPYLCGAEGTIEYHVRNKHGWVKKQGMSTSNLPLSWNSC
jgi:hypothetical protein